MEPTNNMRMSLVLPPAEARETQAPRQAAASTGRCYPADSGARDDASAGFQDEGPNMHGAQEAWQRLLDDIRGADEPVGGFGKDGRKRRRGSSADTSGDLCHTDNEEQDGDLVEIQPPDRMLLPQSHRETCTSLWVVNSSDWIDVEHVLRRMLKCEASECHAFYSIGYVFFRSCAVSHVTTPSAFLKDGSWRFANPSPYC